MTRQKTEFGTQVNPGTADHPRLNQEFKRHREGEGASAPRAGKDEESGEAHKTAKYLWKIIFLKPSPARGERERLWAGTGALWL